MSGDCMEAWNYAWSFKADVDTKQVPSRKEFLHATSRLIDFYRQKGLSEDHVRRCVRMWAESWSSKPNGCPCCGKAVVAAGSRWFHADGTSSRTCWRAGAR